MYRSSRDPGTKKSSLPIEPIANGREISVSQFRDQIDTRSLFFSLFTSHLIKLMFLPFINAVHHQKFFSLS